MTITDIAAYYLAPVSERVAKQRIAVYNGVAVRDIAPTTGGDHYPNHKQPLVNAVRESVTTDDEVVCVGGGRGVAVVHAARAGGTVTVYEAAREMVTLLAETARLNDVSLTVEHARVGPVIDAYGDATDARSIPTAELTGDVLVIDAEGAEQEILPVEDFRTVIVETHPRFGVSLSDIETDLPDIVSVRPDSQDGEVVVACQ
jgi:hypothetical protein